jgi:hypothetical protein
MITEQISLFPNEVFQRPLSEEIQRKGNTLIIPEGIHTIPCTHGLHRFPGKFIPNLPRYLIRQFTANGNKELIFDPFCGSGTTLVEAALEGVPFYGQDIDPLAIMITNAKTTPLSKSDQSFLEKHWHKFNFQKNNQSLYPPTPNLNHWFSEIAVQELSAIKGHCLSLPDRLKRFSLVIFSSIIRRVSYADDQTQKTYVSHTLPKKPPLPSDLFPVFLKRALTGMREYTDRVGSSVEGSSTVSDARKVININRPFNVITSPPYIDSIDYIYNQLLEYFWLLPELGIDSYSAIQQMRKMPMGHVVLKREIELVTSLLNGQKKQFKDLYESIATISPKEALAVSNFFIDFLQHLHIVSNRQTCGSYYICIIGNSFIRGQQVQTSDFLIPIFESVGYDLQDQFTYEIRRHYMKFPRRSNSGKIGIDHILVFRRKK